MIDKIAFTDKSGKEWDLTPREATGAFIMQGSIEGLVGSRNESTVTIPGVPGSFVEGVEIPPFTGGFDLKIVGADGGARGTLYSQLRKAFSGGGRLSIHTDKGKVFFTDVKLDGAIPVPESRPEDAYFLTMPVKLRCDAGLWFERHEEQGFTFVNVTNGGDAIAYPKIQWRGGNVRVVLPSQAVCNLPSVSTWHEVELSTAKGFNITLIDGSPANLPEWRQGRGAFYAEGIPAGGEAEYNITEAGSSLTAEVKFIYDIGYLDPWGN